MSVGTIQYCDFNHVQAYGVAVDYIFLKNKELSESSQFLQLKDINTCNHLLTGRSFPVAIAGSAGNYSQMLITRDDFREFGLAYPDVGSPEVDRFVSRDNL